MKNTIASIALIAVCFTLACTKESGIVSSTPTPAAGTQIGMDRYGIVHRAGARLSGANYSQSIPIDTANRMLASYLGSVGYPYVDTAVRSLSFDADTLRAYLQNPNIVTMKFMFAHQPGYINDGHEGENAGMNPAAITMIVVGLNNSNQYVLNSRSGVYETSCLV